MPMSNRPIKVRLARLFQRTYPSDATRVESAAGPRPCREHDDTIAQAIETEAQRYLKTMDAAQYLVLSPRTLEGMRVRVDGPPFYKLGRGKGRQSYILLLTWRRGSAAFVSVARPNTTLDAVQCTSRARWW